MAAFSSPPDILDLANHFRTVEGQNHFPAGSRHQVTHLFSREVFVQQLMMPDPNRAWLRLPPGSHAPSSCRDRHCEPAIPSSHCPRATQVAARSPTAVGLTRSASSLLPPDPYTRFRRLEPSMRLASRSDLPRPNELPPERTRFWLLRWLLQFQQIAAILRGRQK